MQEGTLREGERSRMTKPIRRDLVAYHGAARRTIICEAHDTRKCITSSGGHDLRSLASQDCPSHWRIPRHIPRLLTRVGAVDIVSRLQVLSFFGIHGPGQRPIAHPTACSAKIPMFHDGFQDGGSMLCHSISNTT